MYHNKFHVHRTGWGPVAENDDTIVYVLENTSPEGAGRSAAVFQIPQNGGCFGFVVSGLIAVSGLFSRRIPSPVYPGQYFTTENGVGIITVQPGTKCVVFQAKGYVGTASIGQIDDEGRLGYIDGCRDTVLHGPLVKGLPCLNALFMPSGINQTCHTHPSTRAGIILRGNGVCQVPTSTAGTSLDNAFTTIDLRFGDVFFLPANGWHKFRTDADDSLGMVIGAFHPSSDFGPTNEEHPMLIGTMVDGISATDIPEIQTSMT